MHVTAPLSTHQTLRTFQTSSMLSVISAPEYHLTKVVLNSIRHWDSVSAQRVSLVLKALDVNALHGLLSRKGAVARLRMESKWIIQWKVQTRKGTNETSYFFFPRVKKPLFFGSSDRGPSIEVGSVAARAGVDGASPPAPLAALIRAIQEFISS